MSTRSLFEEYQNDDSFVQKWNEQSLQRNNKGKLTSLQQSTNNFLQDLRSLKDFLEDLKRLLASQNYWYAENFLNTMEKLTRSSLDTKLQVALSRLSVTEVGQKIQIFHSDLETARKNYRPTRNVDIDKVFPSPDESALIISMFSAWLDPQPNGNIIYYHEVCKGLKLLKDADPRSALSSLSTKGDMVKIVTKQDHKAVLDVFDYLAQTQSELIHSPYWEEGFLRWLVAHATSTTQQEDTQTPQEDTQTPQKPPDQTIQQVAHTPLQAASLPLATVSKEVRKHILVEESVIERIYDVLLLGHVILTGPPGTGKTELARLLPELLWQSAEGSTETAYTTELVTATDEWSTHTLLGGIMPYLKEKEKNNGQKQEEPEHISYTIHYGYLTATLLNNWRGKGEDPKSWNENPQRSTYRVKSFINDKEQTFKGQWLVIDEFNRAQIDIALGEALTALGSPGKLPLRVPYLNGSAIIPIPKDFRIIGTLNSFDRHYLNQISEALKRRFAFIEILPPSRHQRASEQGMVLYKALRDLQHLYSTKITSTKHHTTTIPATPPTVNCDRLASISFEDQADASYYKIDWHRDVFKHVFEQLWNLFEVIRVYRQLGTAQAITLTRQMLQTGLRRSYTDEKDWMHALDIALCDTIADQLQMLLPDELDVLLLYLKHDSSSSFANQYNKMLYSMAMYKPRRALAHIDALTISDEQGTQALSEKKRTDIEEAIQQLLNGPSTQIPPEIEESVLSTVFHLGIQPELPLFVRRLRSFKSERVA